MAPSEPATTAPPEGIQGHESLHFTDIDQFRSDLELIRNSLVSTELSCEQLDTLLNQVHIFGFSLASLDIRQESTRHSDAIDELTTHLQLAKSYGAMEESERVAWLLEELQTRRPLIAAAVEWSEATAQTFAVFKMLHRLQQEFPESPNPIRTALVTARGAPAHERVIRTLRNWDIRLDESLFLGGMEKTDFLRAFEADIFFDDQATHCNRASPHIPTGHVPHGIANLNK